MIKKNVVVTGTHCAQTYPRICWSAIFIGAIVGVGLGFLLHLFAMAIGLSAYSSSSDGTYALAIGGLVGLLIGTIASMVAAGYVTGYLGGFHYANVKWGVIYGFVTWSLALVLAAFLTVPMGSYLTLSTQALANPNPVQVVDGSLGNTQVSSEARNTTGDGQVKVTTPDLAMSAWVLFGLFIIGAFSTCIGACWGIACKRDEVLERTPPLM